MKTSFTFRSLLLLLFAPFFMFNVCGKNDTEDLPIPNTTEYFTWRMPGNNVNVATPDSVVFATYPGNFNVIAAYNTNYTVNSYLSYYGPQSTGTFMTDQFAIFSNGRYYVDNQPVQVTINSFGTTGQPITGSYSGNLKDSVGTGTYTVTGNFKITNPY